MFQKMKKSKGFTLIEMLVVIAIIAVLVSIIIPTVSSATDKAAAATNAANLRSLIAEATTKKLTNDQDSTGYVTLGSDKETITVSDAAPKSKECGECDAGAKAVLTWDDATGSYIASYNGYTLAQFQAVAEGTTAAKDLTTPEITQG